MTAVKATELFKPDKSLITRVLLIIYKPLLTIPISFTFIFFFGGGIFFKFLPQGRGAPKKIKS